MINNDITNPDDFTDAYDPEFKYELDNRLILKWYPKRVALKMIAGSLLELGVGHGYSTREFAKIASDYVVLEGSERVIDLFRKNNPDLNSVNIAHTYFEEYKCKKTYNNIVMGFVLEHVDDPVGIIKQYKKHLDPEGKMFIAVPNSESMHRRVGNLSGLLDDIESLSDSDRELGHQRYFSVAKLRDIAKECGLKVLSEEGLFLKALTTGQLESLKLDDEVFEGFMQLGIGYPELSAGLLVELTHE